MAGDTPRHQVNLVVQVAICGKQEADAVKNNSICGAAVRFFKYLVPANHADYMDGLKKWLDTECQPAPEDAHQEGLEQKKRSLHILYGDACPPSMSNLYNATLESPLHACTGEPDMDSTRDNFLQAISTHVLRCESKPAVASDNQ